MPSRKRSRSAPSASPAAPSSSSSSSAERSAPRTADDEVIAQFAAALRDSEARKVAERERRQAERTKAEELDVARADLERAIGAVKRAQRTRSGIAEADAAWRAAKARVLELETGTRPDWAPPPEDDTSDTDEAQHAEAQAADDESSDDTTDAGQPDETTG